MSPPYKHRGRYLRITLRVEYTGVLSFERLLCSKGNSLPSKGWRANIFNVSSRDSLGGQTPDEAIDIKDVKTLAGDPVVDNIDGDHPLK